jgi:predicted DNA-binding transcriptional regulator AlpA
MMRRGLAASYCDLSVAEFEREIADGRLPMPVKLGNHEHWNKAQLDTALEKISGGADNDWRRKLGLYAA